jgi:hypothetical protein
MSLYGISTANTNHKGIHTENVLKTYIPISCLLYGAANDVPMHCVEYKEGALAVRRLTATDMPLLSAATATTMALRSEMQVPDARFENFPPEDIAVTIGGETRFYEAKTCVAPCSSKGKVFELIIRQNNVACCLRSVLTHSPEGTVRRHKSLDALLNDSRVAQTCYLVTLVWRADMGRCCDALVFTDKALLAMIRQATATRGAIVRGMIDEMLGQFHEQGKMAYKDKKAATVKHQKVTLFPIDASDAMREHILGMKYPVPLSEIWMGEVTKTRSLCDLLHTIELERQIEQNKAKRVTAK